MKRTRKGKNREKPTTLLVGNANNRVTKSKGMVLVSPYTSFPGRADPSGHRATGAAMELATCGCSLYFHTGGRGSNINIPLVSLMEKVT